MTKLVGSMTLILTDDDNKHHSYIYPCCVFDPKTPVNILGVPALDFFCYNADETDPLVEDGNTIKYGAAKLHFIWDHGRHERHFMHGSIHIPELYLNVGHGYFTDFCTRVHDLLFDKMHVTLSSAYSIDPKTSDATQPYVPHFIPYYKGDLDGEEPHHQWYRPEITNTTDQSRNSKPKPTTHVTWSDGTKALASNGSKPQSKSRYFHIGMGLTL